MDVKLSNSYVCTGSHMDSGSVRQCILCSSTVTCFQALLHEQQSGSVGHSTCLTHANTSSHCPAAIIWSLNVKCCGQVLSKLKQELGLKSLTLKFLQLLIVESRITALPGVLDSFETLFNDAINLQVGLAVWLSQQLPAFPRDWALLLGCRQRCARAQQQA